MDSIASHRLDGNAAAGRLTDVFAVEITTIRAVCAGCGRSGQLGEYIVYADAPGTVIRCPSCEAVVIRLAQVGDSTWLDMRGARALRIPLGGTDRS